MFVCDAPKLVLLLRAGGCIPNKYLALLILSKCPIQAELEILQTVRDSSPNTNFYQGGDLTNTKQRQSLTLPDSGDSDWKKADKRFLWNYHMGSSLLNLANSGDRNKVAPFLVLLIHGGVYIHRCSINGVRSFIKISNFQFNIQF